VKWDPRSDRNRSLRAQVDLVVALQAVSPHDVATGLGTVGVNGYREAALFQPLLEVAEPTRRVQRHPAASQRTTKTETGSDTFLQEFTSELEALGGYNAGQALGIAEILLPKLGRVQRGQAAGRRDAYPAS
jgi:hypothetical protein